MIVPHASKFALLLTVLVATGCTLGPDYERPGSVVKQLESFIGAEDDTETDKTIQTDDVPGWWRRLDDPVLNKQVDDMLTNNLRLKQARARVEQAWARRTSAAGDLYPHLSAEGEARRSFSPSSGFTAGIPGLSGGESVRVYDNNIEASLATSWQLDLFGRIRREVQSTEAAARAAIADKRALAQSLIAELARRRVAIRGLQQRRDFQRRIVTIRKQSLEATKRRYEQGTANVTVQDLHSAEQALAAARADLAALKQDLRAEYNRLDVLLGQAPQKRDTTQDNQLAAPQQATPEIVPAGLIDRRPDLRASVLRYKAANADIGVAVANLYPDFSIAASIGSQAERAGDFLTSSEQMIGSITGQITQRLFQGGALRANIDLQREEARERAAQYAEDVLNAVSEVETAMNDDTRLQQRVRHLKNSLFSLRQAEASAEQRYERGVAPLLQLLEVRRRRLEARANLIRTKQAAWNARISMYLALGGDWIQDKGGDSQTAGNKDKQEQSKND